MASASASPSPGPGDSRPKSTLFSSPSPLSNVSTPTGHARTQSHTSFNPPLAPAGGSHRHSRSDSRNGTHLSNTFAPSFIKTEEMQRGTGADAVKGIEGENDFSGKRYVWLKDPQTAFVKGWVVEELGKNTLLVQCDDGTVSEPSAHNRGDANARRSNARSTPTASTRSTLPSSTRQTIWLN